MKIEAGWDPRERFAPESLAVSYGHVPEWSEDALVIPTYQTTPYVFHSAEKAEQAFVGDNAFSKLKYSRMNNPNAEVFENLLLLFEPGAEACAAFANGMAAIVASVFTFLKAGDALIFSEPLYGGTDTLFRQTLPNFGIKTYGFPASKGEQYLKRLYRRLPSLTRSAKILFIETPSNPLNILVDIAECSSFVRVHSKAAPSSVRVVVDNTFLGPLFQHPLYSSADMVVYSATKYIGGHSDAMGGAVLGSNSDIKQIKSMRSLFGSILTPSEAQLLRRSMATLKLRMEKQAENARHIGHFLNVHPKVEKIYYAGMNFYDQRQHAIFDKQCKSGGAMISFEVKGGKFAAFRVLNRLKHSWLMKLAVSLGSVETLVTHPATTTHASMTPKDRKRLGISNSLIRLSVGIEDINDLKHVLEDALAAAEDTN